MIKKRFSARLKENKKILIIMAIIIVLIALVASIAVYYFKENEYKVPEDYIPIGNLKMPVTDSKAEGRNLSSEIIKINTEYTDAKAWLKVPGTSIDTVVFQSTDNERYLRNDRANTETMWGETFLDYRNNLKKLTESNSRSHFIIYGHNTETDTVLTPLLNYKDKKFYKNHQYIEIATVSGNTKWQIFSAYVTDKDFFYTDTKFYDDKDYKSFIKTMQSKSMYEMMPEVGTDAPVLTLSICDYSRSEGRFVVHAKLVK